MLLFICIIISIVVAFTTQANQTRNGTEPTGDEGEFVIRPRPIRGLMTNHGYMVDDPDHPNRVSIWFSGGSIEVQNEVADTEVWKDIFDESLVPRKDTKTAAHAMATKLLLGAHATTTRTTAPTAETNSDGNAVYDVLDDSVPAMSYFLKRPIGGHGEVFSDALCVDESLRIMEGHGGSLSVSTRLPTFQEPNVE